MIIPHLSFIILSNRKRGAKRTHSFFARQQFSDDCYVCGKFVVITVIIINAEMNMLSSSAERVQMEIQRLVLYGRPSREYAS